MGAEPRPASAVRVGLGELARREEPLELFCSAGELLFGAVRQSQLEAHLVGIARKVRQLESVDIEDFGLSLDKIGVLAHRDAHLVLLVQLFAGTVRNENLLHTHS